MDGSAGYLIKTNLLTGGERGGYFLYQKCSTQTQNAVFEVGFKSVTNPNYLFSLMRNI